MAVLVKIPTQLRSVTGGDGETEVDGATTVGEVLDGLYDRYDGLRERIAVDGDLRRFVNVYVGGEDIRFLDGLDTPVRALLGRNRTALLALKQLVMRSPVNLRPLLRIPRQTSPEAVGFFARGYIRLHQALGMTQDRLRAERHIEALR